MSNGSAENKAFLTVLRIFLCIQFQHSARNVELQRRILCIGRNLQHYEHKARILVGNTRSVTDEP